MKIVRFLITLVLVLVFVSSGIFLTLLIKKAVEVGGKRLEKQTVTSNAANPFDANAAKPEHSEVTKEKTNNTYGNVVDYGSGVYYFPHTEANFANALAGFLTAHTNLEVTAMTGNIVRLMGGQRKPIAPPWSEADYGVAVGYFVTFRTFQEK